MAFNCSLYFSTSSWIFLSEILPASADHLQRHSRAMVSKFTVPPRRWPALLFSGRGRGDLCALAPDSARRSLANNSSRKGYGTSVSMCALQVPHVSIQHMCMCAQLAMHVYSYIRIMLACAKMMKLLPLLLR